jgi:hypothetical protein
MADIIISYLRVFIDSLKNGTLKKNKYHLFTKYIPRNIYDYVIRPYVIEITKKESLLLKMYYRNYGNDIYIKNADTESYRKRLQSYFIYLTQNASKGKCPPSYYVKEFAEQLIHNILIIYPNYQFNIVKHKSYDHGLPYYYYLISN